MHPTNTHACKLAKPQDCREYLQHCMLLQLCMLSNWLHKLKTVHVCVIAYRLWSDVEGTIESIKKMLDKDCDDYVGSIKPYIIKFYHSQYVQATKEQLEEFDGTYGKRLQEEKLKLEEVKLTCTAYIEIMGLKVPHVIFCEACVLCMSGG